MSFLGFKALCIAINSLVPHQSSFFVHFKKDHLYFRRRSTPVFTYIDEILMVSLVSRSFFVLLGFAFFTLFHVFRFQNSQVMAVLTLSKSSDIFYPSVLSDVAFLFPLFQCQIPFQYPDRMYFAVCIRVYNSISFFANSLMSLIT